MTPERREMDALVIDEIRRDPSLVVLEHAGRAVPWAPAAVRDRLSQLLAIH